MRLQRLKAEEGNCAVFQTIDSRRHDDYLDDADEDKDEGGTGHVSPEPGVYLFGVLQEIKESETALE